MGRKAKKQKQEVPEEVMKEDPWTKLENDFIKEHAKPPVVLEEKYQEDEKELWECVDKFKDNHFLGADTLVKQLTPVQFRKFLHDNPDFDINRQYHSRPYSSLLHTACATKSVGHLKVLFEEGRKRKIPLEVKRYPHEYPIISTLNNHLDYPRIDACCFLLQQPEFDNPKDRMDALVCFPVDILPHVFLEAILCCGKYTEDEIISNWPKLVEHAAGSVSIENRHVANDWIYVLKSFVTNREFFIKTRSSCYLIACQ